MRKSSGRLDRWVVRDAKGLLHEALVHRHFDDEGDLGLIQVSMGCEPRAQRHTMPRTYVGMMPGPIDFGSYNIIEWRVLEAPTCLACVTAPRLE